MEFHQKHCKENLNDVIQYIQAEVVIDISRTERQDKQRKFYIQKIKEVRKIQRNKQNKRIPQKGNNKEIIRNLLNERNISKSDFMDNHISKDYDYRKDDNIIYLGNKIITKNSSYGIF